MKTPPRLSTDGVRRAGLSGAIVALVAILGAEGLSAWRLAQQDVGVATAAVVRLTTPSSVARPHGPATAGLSALALLLVLLLRSWPAAMQPGAARLLPARHIAAVGPVANRRRFAISYRFGGRLGG